MTVQLTDQTAAALELEKKLPKVANEDRWQYDDDATAEGLVRLNPLGYDPGVLRDEPATVRLLARAVEILDLEPHGDFGDAARRAVEELEEADDGTLAVVDAQLGALTHLPRAEQLLEPPENLQQNIEFLLLALRNRIEGAE